MFLFFLLPSCKECLECHQFNIEPFVKVKFFDNAGVALPIFLDTLMGFEGDSVLTYKDLLPKNVKAGSEFNFPLNQNTDSSKYYVHYRLVSDTTVREIDTFSISYSRETFLENNKIKFRLKDLDTLNHTFDSLFVRCGTSDCLNSNASIEIYK